MTLMGRSGLRLCLWGQSRSGPKGLRVQGLRVWGGVTLRGQSGLRAWVSVASGLGLSWGTAFRVYAVHIGF